MLEVMACHKDGYASQVSSDDLHVTFDPPPDHAHVALRCVAAGAGFGVTVTKASKIDETITKGLETVNSGRAAVLDVWLPEFNPAHRVGHVC